MGKDKLKVPADRKFTMSPEWKKAYKELMNRYSTFEAQSANKDINREGKFWSAAEKAERIEVAKQRIERDKNRWKTESLPKIKDAIKLWDKSQKQKSSPKKKLKANKKPVYA